MFWFEFIFGGNYTPPGGGPATDPVPVLSAIVLRRRQPPRK